MEAREFRGIPTYAEGDPNWVVKTEHWPEGDFDIIYRKGKGTMTAEQIAEGRKAGMMIPPFVYSAPCNTHTSEVEPGVLCDRDTPVKMRDGVTIYADIYRPADGKPAPLIISWGPFGKNMGEQGGFKAMGVPAQAVSNYAKFESADPMYWVPNGYAVANVDPRGVGHSEGYISVWGVQDRYDGYDFIEWAAEQPWCTGKISMFGNSGVCMVIWGIASTQPPHLTCIAGWEGTGDMYRESLTLNGITNPCYNELMINTTACNTYLEDVPNMLATHPFYDEYWQARTPKWEKIKVPAYICSGMCHHHNRGSFEAFRHIRSPKKWMRAHREMEWPDTYNPDNMADLKKFYDRYLKDIHNGWEFTPKVRVDIMDAYDFDYQSNRPEREFPLKRTEYKKIYLDAATHTGSFEPFAAESEVVYDPKTESTTFDIKFTEDTEITGYISAHLFVEARGHDNMDLFLWVKKLGQNGEYVPVSCIDEPYRGAWGYISCKRRELDPELSTDFQPVLAHQKDEPMEPGQVYEVAVEFYPHARIWHAGESLRLEIQGEFTKTDWFEDSHMDPEPDNGEGMHVIHTGGKYSSYLQVPVIPPKYVSGDYIVR